MGGLKGAQMIALLVYGFLILSVIYICLSLYSRAKRRDKLEAWYEDTDKSVDRDAYVRDGLEDYDSSLRRHLILGVYVIPISFVVAMIYITNFM